MASSTVIVILLFFLLWLPPKTESITARNNSSFPNNTNSPHSASIKNTDGILYSMVAVSSISVFSNSLIIHVVRVNRNMHTSTNHLIVNMAISDLLAIFVTAPFASYNLAMYKRGSNWVTDLNPPLGRIACRLKRFLFFSALFCSIYSLIAITFERFMAVIFPLKYKKGCFRKRLYIPIIWLVSLLLPMHQLSKIELTSQNDGILVCEAIRSPIDAHLFIFIGYLLPHVIIVVLYIPIAVSLKRRKAPGEQDQVKTHKTANKVTRMIVCIIVAFDLCWAPLFLMYIGPYTYTYTKYNAFLGIQKKMISKVLVAFNGTSNALIYAIFNEKFRHAFKATLRCEAMVTAIQSLSTRSRSSSNLRR